MYGIIMALITLHISVKSSIYTQIWATVEHVVLLVTAGDLAIGSSWTIESVSRCTVNLHYTLRHQSIAT